jgi:hypothetical protein
MDDLNDKIERRAMKLVRQGQSRQDVALALLRQGLAMFRDPEGDVLDALVVRDADRNSGISVEYPMSGHKIAIISDHPQPQPASHLVELIQEAAELVAGYAELHLAKSPPDLDKADRNIRMAEKLYAGIGEPYTPPEVPVRAAREAQDGHSAFPAIVEPSKLSGDPLDRKAVLAWVDMVLDGCTKSGQRDAYDVVLAMRQAFAQHLEAAPIDFAVALNAFYDDVFERNVKAGWWSDLATKAPKKRNVGELFILFVTELVEAYEAYLTGEPDDKLPEFPGLGVELGDLQIRLADFCGALRAGRIVENTETVNPRRQHVRGHLRHRQTLRVDPQNTESGGRARARGTARSARRWPDDRQEAGIQRDPRRP